MSHDGRMPGLPTGLNGLDKLTCGFEGGQLIIIGARPGVGKTSLAGNWAVSCSDAGGVLFFTLEMSKAELAERILCGQAEVNHYKFRQGFIEDDDQARLAQAAAKLQQSPIYIHDDRGIDVGEMMSVARRVARRAPLAMVIVDYLQLIEGPRFAPREFSREQIVAGISRRLKIMAGELNVPVVCLAQLNRDVEKRDNKRPRMADLRESGAVEQDADIILFLHRPDAYDVEDRPGEADLIVAKNRSGPTGDVSLRFLKDQYRLVDRIDTPDTAKLPGF
jgi:replicative DNA helicase